MVEIISEIKKCFVGADHGASKDYMERVRQATLDVYDELTEDCKNIPETLKAIKKALEFEDLKKRDDMIIKSQDCFRE